MDRPLAYDDLPGWAEDDHAAAFATFLKSAKQMLTKPYRSGTLGVQSSALEQIARDALAAPAGLDAKQFFETQFAPVQLGGADEGFLTGYCEPVIAASRTRTSVFSVPLYARPADLIDVTDANRPPDMASDVRYGRLDKQGRVTAYADRGAIAAGALRGAGLELCWLASKVDAFFIHVQGSARLTMTDGTIMRITYAAKSGHAYTSLGRELARDLDVAPAQMTADRLRAWMDANPDQLDSFLARNRSYIFFREVEGLEPDDGPLAAAKVPLTPGRSLAVDRDLHTFGSPVFVHTAEPLPEDTHPLRKLMIAQDTGSAIIGAARGDYFAGSGDQAGLMAGRIRHRATFYLLVPKAG